MHERGEGWGERDGAVADAEVGIGIGIDDVAGGEIGDAGDGASVEQYQRAARSHVQGQRLVVQTASEHCPAVVVGEDV
ncbi:hypothetical protein NJ76_24945 [Rhodococcus sp. IITR03]|nr:hypothetical protein NJ76_24945 [Rhodococcus sp. IITR03]